MLAMRAGAGVNAGYPYRAGGRRGSSARRWMITEVGLSGAIPVHSSSRVAHAKRGPSQGTDAVGTSSNQRASRPSPSSCTRWTHGRRNPQGGHYRDPTGRHRPRSATRPRPPTAHGPPAGQCRPAANAGTTEVADEQRPQSLFACDPGNAPHPEQPRRRRRPELVVDGLDRPNGETRRAVRERRPCKLDELVPAQIGQRGRLPTPSIPAPGASVINVSVTGPVSAGLSPCHR